MKVLLPIKVRVVLIVSLAIEAANFFLLAPPIDVGYPADTAWYIQLIGLQWVMFHAAGLFSVNWVEGVVGCRQANVVMSCRRVDIAVLFVSGYLTTVFLLFLVKLGFQQFLRKRAA